MDAVVSPHRREGQNKTVLGIYAKLVNSHKLRYSANIDIRIPSVTDN